MARKQTPEGEAVWGPRGGGEDSGIRGDHWSGRPKKAIYDDEEEHCTRTRFLHSLSFRYDLCLPTLFYSVLLSVSAFMSLSLAFHSINFPDYSLLSHSVLPVLFLPYWSFQLFISS